MGKRIVIGVVLAALFLSMLYLGRTVQAIAFAWAAVWAVHEMQHLFAQKSYRPFMAPAYLFAAAYAALLYLLPQVHWMFLWMLCVLIVITERVINPRRTTQDAFAGLSVFLYPLPFFAVLLLPSVKFGEAQGAVAFLSAFACPLMGDTLAYFIGTFFGRHKLCPDISPKKTVEGSVASFLGSILGGALVYLAQGLWGTQVPLAALLLLGAACGILGQVGDLFASTIKRWANIKDFGSIFPGHGGILDRIDSVLLCAPAVYLCFFLLNVLS